MRAGTEATLVISAAGVGRSPLGPCLSMIQDLLSSLCLAQLESLKEKKNFFGRTRAGVHI